MNRNRQEQKYSGFFIPSLASFLGFFINLPSLLKHFVCYPTKARVGLQGRGAHVPTQARVIQTVSSGAGGAAKEQKQPK